MAVDKKQFLTLVLAGLVLVVMTPLVQKQVDKLNKPYE